MNENNNLPDAMTDPPTCPVCGAPLTRGQDGNLRPAYLLHAAMGIRCGGAGEVHMPESLLRKWPNASRETTMIYLHTLKRPGAGGASPLDLP